MLFGEINDLKNEVLSKSYIRLFESICSRTFNWIILILILIIVPVKYYYDWNILDTANIHKFIDNITKVSNFDFKFIPN